MGNINTLREVCIFLLKMVFISVYLHLKPKRAKECLEFLVVYCRTCL